MDKLSMVVYVLSAEIPNTMKVVGSSTTRPTRGIAVYNGASATPSIILSRKAVERILKN